MGDPRFKKPISAITFRGESWENANTQTHTFFGVYGVLVFMFTIVNVVKDKEIELGTHLLLDSKTHLHTS